VIRNLTFLAAAFAFGLVASSAALATPRIVEHGDGPHVEHDAPGAANLVGGSVARIFGAEDERIYVSERVLVTRPGRTGALALIGTVSANGAPWSAPRSGGNIRSGDHAREHRGRPRPTMAHGNGGGA